MVTKESLSRFPTLNLSGRIVRTEGGLEQRHLAAIVDRASPQRRLFALCRIPQKRSTQLTPLIMCKPHLATAMGITTNQEQVSGQCIHN